MRLITTKESWDEKISEARRDDKIVSDFTSLSSIRGNVIYRRNKNIVKDFHLENSFITFMHI